MAKKILGYGIVGLLALTLIAGTVYIVLGPSSPRATQGQSRTVAASSGDTTAERESRPGYERERTATDETGYRGGQNGTPAGGGGTPIDGTVQTVRGVAVEVDNDLVLRTESDDLLVGLGPAHYREQAGFTIRRGDELEISGFAEAEEFKAATVRNLTTGASIVLRDDAGHPMWAGQGNLRNQP